MTPDMQIPSGFGPNDLPAGQLLVVQRAAGGSLQSAYLRFRSAHGSAIPDHPNGGTMVLYPIGAAHGPVILANDPDLEPLYFVDEEYLVAHWPKQLV